MAKLGINTGSIPNDGTGDSMLAGAVKINSNFNEIYTLLGDGTNLSLGIVTSVSAGTGITVTPSTGSVTVSLDPSIVGASGTWATTAVGIHTLKNVGIGTTNPTQKLSVTGNVIVTEFLGLGTASPLYPLHIRSNPGVSEPSILVAPSSTVRPATIRLTNGSSSRFVLGLQDSSGNSDFSAFPAYAGVVGVTSANPLIFVTNSVEGFRLSEDGNLGLNRNSPTSKLDVFGDARISGVVTAASFVGSGVGLTGVSANYTNTAGFSTYATSAGISTYANNAGVSTYASTAGVSTYATSAGISTTATTAGYATTAGISTTTETIDITNTNGLTTIYYPTFVEDRTSGQYLRADVDLTYRTDDNILTVPNISVGTGASIGQLNVSGVSTFSDKISVSGSQYSTFGNGLVVLGTAVSDLDGNNFAAQLQNGLQITNGASITSYITSAGRIVGTGASINGTISATQLGVSGISTLETVQVSSGVVTATSGIVTYYGDASYMVSGRWSITGDGYSFAFVGIGLSVPTNDPVLYFARGCTYDIVNNSGDYRFEIRDQSGGTPYNNGVVGNGGTMTTIKFTVPLDAPNTLYYQCPDFIGMGNTIRVYPDRI